MHRPATANVRSRRAMEGFGRRVHRESDVPRRKVRRRLRPGANRYRTMRQLWDANTDLHEPGNVVGLVHVLWRGRVHAESDGSLRRHRNRHVHECLHVGRLHVLLRRACVQRRLRLEQLRE